MKKTGSLQKLTALILMLAMLFAVTSVASAEESAIAYDAETGTLSGVDDYEAVEGALLYTIDAEYTLIYNVTYTADVSGAVVYDATGQEISDVDALAAELAALDDAFTADLYLDADGSAAAILLTECTERPVIGVSWMSDDMDEWSAEEYDNLFETLYRNGGIPVQLPQITDAESAQAALAEVDGIVVTGGEDIDPALYDEEPTPHGSNGINTVRDTSDINLIQQAIALDIPMLAICRGEQMFNVAMGGALIQDVPLYLGELVTSGEIDESRVTEVLEDTGYWSDEADATIECEEDEHYRVIIDGVIHSETDDYTYKYLATISTDSKWLYDIVGDTSMEYACSWHHQAVDPERLGDGITAVAYTSDGIIEAIEYQDNLFALGVQFHPENDTLADYYDDVDVDQEVTNSFFRTLIEYAGIYAANEAEEAA